MGPDKTPHLSQPLSIHRKGGSAFAAGPTVSSVHGATKCSEPATRSRFLPQSLQRWGNQHNFPAYRLAQRQNKGAAGMHPEVSFPQFPGKRSRRLPAPAGARKLSRFPPQAFPWSSGNQVPTGERGAGGKAVPPTPRPGTVRWVPGPAQADAPDSGRRGSQERARVTPSAPAPAPRAPTLMTLAACPGSRPPSAPTGPRDAVLSQQGPSLPPGEPPCWALERPRRGRPGPRPAGRAAGRAAAAALSAESPLCNPSSKPR